MSWGLLLSILAGPIFFTIVQTGIEYGSRAGVVLAAGQWLSDLIYIGIVAWGGRYLELLIEDPTIQKSFIFYVGLGGSIVLLIMGTAMWLTRPTPMTDQHIEKRSLQSLFFKGWLLNTVSPTPIIFWATLMGSALVKGYSDVEIVLLFSSVMLMVVVTDVLKAYAGKRIRRWLSPQHLVYVRRIAASVLLGFGLLLLLRSVWA